MLGLAISLVRLMLRLTFGMLDMMFWACTLGKVDPRARRFV
ncbi:hypothetical protein GCM10010448_34180 [Streptomyces glomeratus]|uniref:Uncharacterized protein n=1 Tax=Streptomyces glomeratus TaxID=284452 RepID=A0ABP6LKW9_9ACTN